MKRLIVILSSLLLSVTAFSQQTGIIQGKKFRYQKNFIPSFTAYPNDSSILFIDRVTGEFKRTHVTGGGGGGGTLQQAITAGSTLTTNNTINSGANRLTFNNNRGDFILDNSPEPQVKINGTGAAPLFAADSGGVNRMRLMPRGQLALGDSVNLSVYIGHNSGLNYAPQGAEGNAPGRWNTSLGTNTLSSLTIGNDNVAIGCNAVRYLTTGGHNIGIGTAALNGLTTGGDNVSIGIDAMASTNGDRNTAVGSYSQFTTQGSYNTSFGYGTLYGVYPPTSHTGNYNTVMGYRSGSGITTASENTAVGGQSLFTVSTGGGYLGGNTALGHNAGYSTNGYGNLFLGHSAGVWSNENHAFYLHNWGTSTENEGKERSMFYGNFSPSGANRLRMNGKFGVHSLNSDASWMPDSAFHVVGNSWLNGKIRITDGTQANGYVLTSDANGNASWQPGGGGGGGSAAGNYGNIQLNRNGAFATPGSDSLGYTTSAGLFVYNNMSVGNAANNVAALNIAAKDGEGKLAFKYSTTDYGYFKVNTASGQVSLGSDQYPVTINSGSQVTINNDLALNTTTLGLGRKLSLRFTGVEYGYFAVETNNSEFRAVSPNTYDFTWRNGSIELMRLKESNGNFGIGTNNPTSKLTVNGAGLFRAGNSTLTIYDTTNNGVALHTYGPAIDFKAKRGTVNTETSLAAISAFLTDTSNANYTADLIFSTANSVDGNTERMRLKHDGSLVLQGNATVVGLSVSDLGLNRTITPGGTTGNQTINKASGTVNIAAGGTTVTVTNSLVTANSIVYAVIRSNDATATIKNVVPAAGSFTITLGTAATAETSIGFMVTN